MPASVVPDPTNAGTLRPNEKPLAKKRTHFETMDLPDFDLELHLPKDVSPDDPITLFTQYYTPEIVDRMVEATNAYKREIPLDIVKSRSSKWYPTTRKELYLFLAFCIYMTIVPMNKISDY